MSLEVHILKDKHPCFRRPKPGEIDDSYQRIKLLWRFSVKFDGRHRARCVAGGHMTDDHPYDLYSGVVDLENIRIVFLAAALMKLGVIAADVGSAYLMALTIEKICVLLGEEWEELAGVLVIVIRALYGLKISGAMYWQFFADTVMKMGFRPSRADPNVWMRHRTDHYEYIGVIVDDLLVFSKEAHQIIEPLKEVYNLELKGVGTPEYYSGGDLYFNPVTGLWEFSAKTYIENVVGKIEKLYCLTLKNYGSPMEPEDHPELDESPFLLGESITCYQMLIGCGQWAITLGRFDVQYTVNTMSRYSTKPRQGHEKRMLRMFGYLKFRPKLRIAANPKDARMGDFAFSKDNDWTGLYPDSKEPIDPDQPEPLCPPLTHTVMVDASHAGNHVDMSSVGSYIYFLGQMPVKWYSKKLATIECATYGSELVMGRIATEAVIGMRYKCRMLGIAVAEPANVLVDNMSVVNNLQLPSSALKKKHHACAYHKCREAIAIGVARCGKIHSSCNIADMGTKPLGPHKMYHLCKEVLYGRFSDD